MSKLFVSVSCSMKHEVKLEASNHLAHFGG